MKFYGTLILSDYDIGVYWYRGFALIARLGGDVDIYASTKLIDTIPAGNGLFRNMREAMARVRSLPLSHQIAV